MVCSFYREIEKQQEFQAFKARLDLFKPTLLHGRMPKIEPVSFKRAKYALNIWALLTFCCAFFLALPYISAPTGKPDPNSPLPLILSVLAVFMGASTVFIRVHLLSRKNLGEVGAKVREKYAEKETQILKFQQYWFMFHLIAWGVNESLASFGVMIFSLTGEPGRAVPFAIAGIVLNLVTYPNFVRDCEKAGLEKPWSLPQKSNAQIDN